MRLVEPSLDILQRQTEVDTSRNFTVPGEHIATEPDSPMVAKAGLHQHQMLPFGGTPRLVLAYLGCLIHNAPSYA